MDRALAGQRRYLAALDEAARAAPSACANQLAALARERALVTAATTVAGYRAASGELFELARGTWLDRVVGHARTAAAVDDPWALTALRVELDATLAATGPDDFGARLIAASPIAAAIRLPGIEVIGAYARLLWSTVRARVETRALERAAAAAEAIDARRRLRALDASFDPRALAPRYRWRTPWTGAGLRALAGWLDEVGGTAPAERARPPDGPAELAAIEAAAAAWRAGLPGSVGGAVAGEVSVADVVAPYVGLARLAGDAPEIVAIRAAAAAMIAAAADQPTPQDVLAVWTEHDLQVALARAPTEAGLVRVHARLAVWPEPLLAHHAHTLATQLSASRTTTEVDLVSVHADACLGVETDWNRALAAGLLAPVRATFVAAWEHTAEARRGIPAAWSVAHALVGAGADLDTVPWLAGFLRDLVVRHAGGDPGALGASLGEAGGDVVGEARAAIAAVRANGELVTLDLASLRAWLHTRWGTPPASVPGVVQLWDREVTLADLRDATAAPARPRVTFAGGRFEADLP